MDISNSTLMSQSLGYIYAKTVNFENTTFPELQTINRIGSECEIIYLTNVKAPKLASMQSAFQGSPLKKIYMRGIQTPSLTDLSSCFAYCSSLSILDGIEDLNTENVTTMNRMFASCNSITDFSRMNNLDIGNVTDFDYMCMNCSSHPVFTKRAGT